MEPNSSKINSKIVCKISKESVMDIVSKILDVRVHSLTPPLAPPRSNFLHFHAKFGMFLYIFRVGAPRTPAKSVAANSSFL